MGTTYSVTLPTSLQDRQSALELEINEQLTEINQVMSTYITDSELSRINRNDSLDWQPVSPALYHVLSNALATSHKTDGAFDVTIGALVNTWGFGPEMEPATIPSKTVLNKAMQQSGYGHLSLRAEPAAIKKDIAGLYLDLSGIAKGYAVDHIAVLLDERGITDYLVEIGGEVRARGHNSHGELWHIGIEKPDPNTRTIETIIRLDNRAIATSGDYRNYFIHEGNRYSHTIDPATGWPAPYTNQSVTVMADSSMIADALATALSVMGPDKGLEYARQNDIAALFMHDDSGILRIGATAAMRPSLEDN